jgi:hypothetical protein
MDALKGGGAGAGAGPGPETDLVDDNDIRLDERRDSPETARRVGLGGIGGASLPLTDETDRLEYEVRFFAVNPRREETTEMEEVLLSIPELL